MRCWSTRRSGRPAPRVRGAGAGSRGAPAWANGEREGRPVPRLRPDRQLHRRTGASRLPLRQPGTRRVLTATRWLVLHQGVGARRAVRGDAGGGVAHHVAVLALCDHYVLRFARVLVSVTEREERMPRRAKRPCAAPGCPTLVQGGRCSTHRRKREQARGTRQERGYDRQHERWRGQVLRRDDYICQPCLRSGRLVGDCDTADHIVPFDQGGARLEPANGQAICSTCHGFKTAWERWHDATVEPWPETEAGQ